MRTHAGTGFAPTVRWVRASACPKDEIALASHGTSVPLWPADKAS